MVLGDGRPVLVGGLVGQDRLAGPVDLWIYASGFLGKLSRAAEVLLLDRFGMQPPQSEQPRLRLLRHLLEQLADAVAVAPHLCSLGVEQFCHRITAKHGDSDLCIGLSCVLVASGNRDETARQGVPSLFLAA
jgi:hypothetical protein